MRRLARAGAAVAAGLGAWCALGAVAIAPGTTTCHALAALPPPWVLPRPRGALLGLVLGTRRLGRARRAALRRPRLRAALRARAPCPPRCWPGRGCSAAHRLGRGRSSPSSWRSPGPAAAPCGPRLAGRRRDPRRPPSLAGSSRSLASSARGRARTGGSPAATNRTTSSSRRACWLDGDLQIENNHDRGDYGEYFSGVLKPDFLKRGTQRPHLLDPRARPPCRCCCPPSRSPVTAASSSSSSRAAAWCRRWPGGWRGA